MALTSFKRKDLVFRDYKEKAVDDHDNPKITGFPDNKLLNRTEAYEMVHFINSCAKKWNWDGNPVVAYQNVERTIRAEVPTNLHSHAHIYNWLVNNKSSF